MRTAHEPFVRLTGDALPEIKHVAWTNFCDIGWRFDPSTRTNGDRRVPGQSGEGRGGPGAAEFQRGVWLRRADGAALMRPLVLKFGGELLESIDERARVAAFVSAARASRPIVVIHGGGRAIDAELARRAIAPRKVDGLRITDGPTLDAVISVLAGSANTALVAAFVAAGVPAVGLTGADAGFGRAVRVGAHREHDGRQRGSGICRRPGRRGSRVDSSVVVASLRAGRREPGHRGRHRPQRERGRHGLPDCGVARRMLTLSSPARPPACSTKPGDRLTRSTSTGSRR